MSVISTVTKWIRGTRIFISYPSPKLEGSEITDIAEQLEKCLKQKFRTTRDVEAEIGTQWEKFMATAVRHDFAMFLIGEDFLRSEGCLREAEYMLKRWLVKKVIIVLIPPFSVENLKTAKNRNRIAGEAIEYFDSRVPPRQKAKLEITIWDVLEHAAGVKSFEWNSNSCETLVKNVLKKTKSKPWMIFWILFQPFVWGTMYLYSLITLYREVSPTIDSHVGLATIGFIGSIVLTSLLWILKRIFRWLISRAGGLLT